MSTVTKLTSGEETRQDRIIRNIDAFISALTGAGYAQDKFISYSFAAQGELSDQTLLDLYTDHDIAAAIVERKVLDALRSGYELDWQGATDLERRAVVDWAETEYQLTEEVKQARIFARLFGGGGVFIGADGQIDSPRFPGAPIGFLRATPSTDLEGWLFYPDPAQQNYGQVMIYRLRQLQFNQAQNLEPFVMVHESRVIPFYGVRTTDQETIRNKGWGKSVLHRVYDVLKKFDSSFDSILHTLAESSIPVYKVKALLDLLASENGELLAKRFELINAAKGQYRAVIMDMDEVFERVEAALNEASNVVDKAMTRVSAAAQMPQTVLWGMAPSGQNATGKSDLENWNQQVASEQSLVLGPAIEALYKILLAQTSSPLSRVPDDLKVTFPAVETPSIQDQVNFYAQLAGADAVYEQMGAASAAEIARKRSQQKGTLFPSVDLSYLEELDALRKEQLLNPPDPMALMDPGNEPDSDEAPGDNASR